MYELKYTQDLAKLSANEVAEIKKFVFDSATREFVTVQLQDVAPFGDEQTQLYGCYDMNAIEVADYNNNGGLWLYNRKKDIQELFI